MFSCVTYYSFLFDATFTLFTTNLLWNLLQTFTGLNSFIILQRKVYWVDTSVREMMGNAYNNIQCRSHSVFEWSYKSEINLFLIFVMDHHRLRFSRLNSSASPWLRFSLQVENRMWRRCFGHIILHWNDVDHYQIYHENTPWNLQRDF